MSVTEMQKKAIEQIAQLKDEKALEEIIHYLSELEKTGKRLDLSKHFDVATKTFDEALQKLAQ